jgi:transposase
MEDIMAMSGKERERMKVIMRLTEKTLTQRLAAEQLQISVRQVQRLLRSYRLVGDKAIISKQRDKKSNNRLAEDFRKQIVELIQLRYPDFGPTFAREKLVEVHGMKVSISTVRNIMIENKIWEAKKWKVQNIHKCRASRDCIGELIQMDGSYHDWFEGRAPKCCLLVLIDDATSRLMLMEFVEWESSFGYFQILKRYLKTYGRPLSLYTDRLAVFETTRKAEKNYRDTQFHRATKELGINLILALSPQAKGRVERANGTLQDRLVKEMRLAHISTIQEANTFLPGFIETHNKKFAKQPKSSIDAHRSFETNHNLEQILCLHHERKITNDLMVYWGGRRYQITEVDCRYRLGGKKVLILEQQDKSIEFMYEGHLLSFVNFDEQSPVPEKIVPDNERIAVLANNWHKARGGKPNVGHPWKKWCPHSQPRATQAC